METLIKHAINRKSTDFIEYAKIKLEKMYDKSKNEIRDDKIKSINEAKKDTLAEFGITGFNPGIHYIPSTPTSFVAVTDDIAREIEQSLDNKNINYTKTGLNFIITAM